jgi:hypothetical protein
MLNERERRLLEFLNARVGDVPLQAAADAIGLPLYQTRNLVLQLRNDGLVITPHLAGVQISKLGMQALNAAAGAFRWIVRTGDSGGWQLVDPRPESVEAIRQALEEAISLMNMAAGPAEQVYNDGDAIRLQLETDLQIALARESRST